MQKTIYIWVIFLSVFFYQCSDKKNNISDFDKVSYQLPRVLMITSGSIEGNGKVAEGVVVAIQSFNKNGAVVKLATRDILNDFKRLKSYNILILSSAIDYHDADRQYSLAYMSDYEIENIRAFVEGGGILIAGDHVGRNYIDGTDRITVFQKLMPENWGLAQCFGVSLEERNIKGFGIEGYITEGLNGVFKQKSKNEFWTLVVDSVYSGNIKELAWWTHNTEKYPALIQNDYNKGIAFLLPSSYLLHPANDGGLWSAAQIQTFYDYVLSEYEKKHACKIQLNIWPNAHDYAFCVSLNSSGNISEYRKLNRILADNGIRPTYFVQHETNTEIEDFLVSSDLDLQSNGFGNINYQNATYPFVKRDIIDNRNAWSKEFTGFRFPYTKPHYLGLMALSEFNYKYESSVGADNINFFNGSVFPYHIPISNDGYYRMTDMLEISPIYHDDYYFFSDIVKPGIYQADKQLKDAQLFEKYLFNYWDYAVKPYHGLMVFMGHPMYVAHNDTTLEPLKKLLTQVKSDNTWITNLNDVADYWNNLNDLNFTIEEDNNHITVYVSGPENVEVKNLTLNILNRPNEIMVRSGQYKLLDKGSKYQIVFDAMDKQELIMRF